MQAGKKHFTLFELLISLALLVIVATVILRMMVITGELWSYTHEQTDLYMNNKVLFNTLDEELSGIVYNYDNAGNADGLFAPLYIANEIGAGTTDLVKRYEDDDKLNKGTALCFVTHTKRGNDSNDSDICKVGYVYLPPRTGNSDVYSFWDEDDDNVFNERNGVLVRVILNENDSSCSFAGDAGEVSNFYGNNQYFNFDLSHAQQIIDGVIDFKVNAYEYDESSKEFSEAEHNDSTGMKDVAAIRVSITMLPPERLEEFRRDDYQQASEDERRDFLQKHARTFVRTFWIDPLVTQDEGE